MQKAYYWPLHTIIKVSEKYRADNDSASNIIQWDKHENFSCTIPDHMIFHLITTVVVQKYNTDTIQHITSLTNI